MNEQTHPNAMIGMLFLGVLSEVHVDGIAPLPGCSERKDPLRRTRKICRLLFLREADLDPQ